MTEFTRETEIGLSEWKCGDCGAPLMATKTGSVCPEGCGRLMPRMPAAVRRVNHAIIMGIQCVTNKLGHYFLEDGTEVLIGKRVNREVRHDEKATVAREGTRIWQIRPKEDCPVHA